MKRRRKQTEKEEHEQTRKQEELKQDANMQETSAGLKLKQQVRQDSNKSPNTDLILQQLHFLHLC